MSRRRKRNRRIPDRYRVGRSELAPYDRSESSKSRHQRRKQTALEFSAELREWLEQHAFNFEVHNNGHHWIMRHASGLLVEWWPSSAKTIFDKRWRDGYHCHDWQQLRDVITSKLFPPSQEQQDGP